MGTIKIFAATKQEAAFLDPEFEIPSWDYADIVITGVGKVNAALAATRACLEGAAALLVVGTAGGLDLKLKIGDIIMATEAIQHDVDITALGFDPGVIPFHSSHIWKSSNVFQSKIAELAQWRGIIYTSGRVLTGDQFINAEKGKKLLESFNGIAIDMETAAIAQVAEVFNVPWIGLRVISDLICDPTQKELKEQYFRFVDSRQVELASLVRGIAREVKILSEQKGRLLKL